jgi:group I intron endonuclease
MTCGIYILLNKNSGERYIGSSINIEKRVNDHFSALRKGKHCNSRIQEGFNDSGEESFTFFILQQCPEECLVQEEQSQIELLHPEYNIAPIAQRPVWSQESRDKLSETRTGTGSTIGGTFIKSKRYKWLPK